MSITPANVAVGLAVSLLLAAIATGLLFVLREALEADARRGLVATVAAVALLLLGFVAAAMGRLHVLR